MVRHRNGIAQRLADRGGRPDLLAGERVEAVQEAVAAVQAERFLRPQDDWAPAARADHVFPKQFGLFVLFGQGYEAVMVLEDDAAFGIDCRRVAKRYRLLLGQQIIGERPDKPLGPRRFRPLGALWCNDRGPRLGGQADCAGGDDRGVDAASAGGLGGSGVTVDDGRGPDGGPGGG